MLLALFGANLFGLRMAAGVQLFVLVLLSALAIYATGDLEGGRGEPRSDAAPRRGGLSGGGLFQFATSGAHLVVGLGGEVENAERTLPLVILAATLIVAIFYAAIALAAVGWCPWESMVNQPLTVAGEAFLLDGRRPGLPRRRRGCRDRNDPQRPVHPASSQLHGRRMGRSAACVRSGASTGTAPWVILSVMAGIGLVLLIAASTSAPSPARPRSPRRCLRSSSTGRSHGSRRPIRSGTRVLSRVRGRSEWGCSSSSARRWRSSA